MALFTQELSHRRLAKHLARCGARFPDTVCAQQDRWEITNNVTLFSEKMAK
jgi:hypothetical protein